jgi:hypothetical protein
MVGGLIRVPITWASPYDARTRVMQVSSVFCGLGSIAAALLLFSLLGLHAGLAVPIISSAWVSFYFLSYHQSKLELLCYVAGIFLGWFAARDYFQYA